MKKPALSSPLCRILSDGPAVGPARDILRKSVVILCVEEKALFGIIDRYLLTYALLSLLLIYHLLYDLIT